MKEHEPRGGADNDAIKRVITGGSDISRPMKIDFHVVAPNKETALKIGSVIRQRGFEVESYYDRERGGVTCSCSRKMILSQGEVLRVQAELDEISRPFGGRSDGWGTFGNKEEANQSPHPTRATGPRG